MPSYVACDWHCPITALQGCQAPTRPKPAIPAPGWPSPCAYQGWNITESSTSLVFYLADETAPALLRPPACYRLSAPLSITHLHRRYLSHTAT